MKLEHEEEGNEPYCINYIEQLLTRYKQEEFDGLKRELHEISFEYTQGNITEESYHARSLAVRIKYNTIASR